MELPEVIQPLAVSPPLRVLVMISSPSDYPALDVEAEWKRLNESLADLIAAGTIAMERLDEATLGNLQRKLRRAQYHIFHFIGHGEFDQALQEGVLLLERENRRGHRVGSQYLGMLLHDQVSLRIAILNACEGARSSRQDPFAGSAQSLVQQGIPAVIAMQFEIADDVASTFAHEFYGALADGYPIDAAVTEARKAIFAGGREIEWATPVLYLRAPDGRVFDLAAGSQRETLPIPSPPSPPEPVAAASRHPVATPPELPPNRAAALLRHASALLAQGKYEDALTALAEARGLHPDPVTLAQLTSTAEEQRAVAETRAQRSAAFRSHLEAASALLARKSLDEAAAHVAKAMELKPNDPEAGSLKDSITRAEGWQRSRTRIVGTPPTTLPERRRAPSEPPRRTKSGTRKKRSPSDESDLLE